MKTRRLNKRLSIVVAFAITFGSLSLGGNSLTRKSHASNKTETMTIEFEEQLDGSVRSKSVNIPNLKNVVNVEVDTGSITHSVSGEDVTVNVVGGTPSRQVNNPTKYSKVVNDSSTSSSNSFSSTKAYSSGGYTGSLGKSGTSSVISGSYTAAQSRTETATRTAQGSNTTPATVPYSSGGYTGTLSKYTTNSKRVQTGGSYTSSDTKYVTKQASSSYNSGGYSGTLTRYVSTPEIVSTTECWTEWQNRDGIYKSGDTINYDNGTQKGILKFVGSQQESEGHPDHRRWYSSFMGLRCNYTKAIYHYQGNVTRPESDTRTYRTDYTANYSGTVTKPAVDTRVWEQEYSGTVYKAGNDDYYKYTVTIEYIDNSDPVIELTTPTNGTIGSSNPGFTELNIVGSVKDQDVGDILTIKYKLSTGDEGNIQTVEADGTSQSFNGPINVSNLDSGNHNIILWAEDGRDGKSLEVTRTFIVDKEPPTLEIGVQK